MISGHRRRRSQRGPGRCHEPRPHRFALDRNLRVHRRLPLDGRHRRAVGAGSVRGPPAPGLALLRTRPRNRRGAVNDQLVGLRHTRCPQRLVRPPGAVSTRRLRQLTRATEPPSFPTRSTRGTGARARLGRHVRTGPCQSNPSASRRGGLALRAGTSNGSGRISARHAVWPGRWHWLPLRPGSAGRKPGQHGRRSPMDGSRGPNRAPRRGVSSGSCRVRSGCWRAAAPGRRGRCGAGSDRPSRPCGAAPLRRDIRRCRRPSQVSLRVGARSRGSTVRVGAQAPLGTRSVHRASRGRGPRSRHQPAAGGRRP